MLLTIDIGNTQIASGVYRGDELAAHWRLSSNYERTEDETWMIMTSICRAMGQDLTQVSGMVISSVVPDMIPTFEKMSQKYLHINPVIVRHDLNLGIKIRYDNPSNVGADRICNAVAGFARFGGPLIIVDLGTATTFDVVSKDGDYIGGVIAPGIETSAAILHRRAAKLPRVELRFPEKVIGVSTESSMQSGLLYGAVEMVDGLIRRIGDQLGQRPKTIATGGLARVLLGQAQMLDHLEPFLTLEGMRLIYERNRG